jgi:hypothetical protein
MSSPGIPDPARVRARWTDLRERSHARRTTHLDTAVAVFRATNAARNDPDGYHYFLPPFGAPMPMPEAEYFALAGRHTKAPITNLEDAFTARREDSDRIREGVNKALEAYRASLEAGRKDMDALMVQAGFVAAQVELSATLSFGTKLALIQVQPEAGATLPRMLPAQARIEITGEREMAAIAGKEAAAHHPKDPAAALPLLAIHHRPRFRELMAPGREVAGSGGNDPLSRDSYDP